MFQRMIDDFKQGTGNALRLTSLASVAALALLVTTSFLCAAAFVYVLQKYGLIEACLTGAGLEPGLAAGLPGRRPLAEGWPGAMPGPAASYQPLITMLEGKPGRS